MLIAETAKQPTSMYRTKAGFLSLVLLLAPDQSQSMDECRYGEAFRCGDLCIEQSECMCGGSIFGVGEGKWCCTEEGASCQGKGEFSEHWEHWRGEE